MFIKVCSICKNVFLISFVFLFSGQVHIISSDRDDSDDEFVAAARPPRMTDLQPNTKELDVSEHIRYIDFLSIFHGSCSKAIYEQ